MGIFSLSFIPVPNSPDATQLLVILKRLSYTVDERTNVSLSSLPNLFLLQRGCLLTFSPWLSSVLRSICSFLTILNVTVDYTYLLQPSDMSFNIDLAGYTPRGTAMTDGTAEFLTLSLTTWHSATGISKGFIPKAISKPLRGRNTLQFTEFIKMTFGEMITITFNPYCICLWQILGIISSHILMDQCQLK